MKIQSVEALIDWTKAVHAGLARCLKDAVLSEPEERAGQLLEYLAGHQQRLQKMIAGLEAQADIKALHTLVYDYGVHPPLIADQLHDKPWGTMTFEQVAQEVFAVHSEVAELYRYLIGRSVIAEESQLLEAILEAEQHETKQMAQQVNRGRDI